jgi:hypothetical protein
VYVSAVEGPVQQSLPGSKKDRRAKKCDRFVEQAMEEMGGINICERGRFSRIQTCRTAWTKPDVCNAVEAQCGSAAFLTSWSYANVLRMLPCLLVCCVCSDDIYADVCLPRAASSARQLALMLRDHPAGLSTRPLITGGQRLAAGCCQRAWY